MPHLEFSRELTLLLVLGATAISGVVNSATGVGGAGILMVIVLALLPREEALVVVALSQISRNVSLSLSIYKEAHWDVVKLLWIGGFVGAVIGAFLVGVVPELFFRRALGIGLILFVINELYKPHEDWEVPRNTMPAVGFLTGAFSALTGTTGPIAAPFLFRHGLTGVHLVATVTLAALVMNAAKLSVYGALGFFHEIDMVLVWGTMVSVVIGVQIGVTLLRRMSHGRFRMLFLGMLFFIAIGYLFGGVKENPAATDARLHQEMRDKWLMQHE